MVFVERDNNKMGKRFCSHELVFIGIVILVGVTFPGYAFVKGDSISGQKILEDRRKINHIRKHAVKSIQSEDGDIIDCIDIYKQPAFDHPALQNHIIQMTPSYDPTMETMTTTKIAKTSTMGKRKEQSSKTVTSVQLWQKSGRCPQGTIPIRRIKSKELLTSPSYGRKKPSFHHPVTQPNGNEKSYLQQANHSKAILLTEGYMYSGAKGDIKVWNPFVESDDEYSTSQVSLQSGPYNDFESIESGWAVNPNVYGDRQTRLHTYWTADASKTTGCFDLTCPGFIQTSKDIALGAAIYPISVPGGLPYQITLYLFKDPNTSNWWVQYGEKINIGYWPPSLFTLLPHNAETVNWGGVVYSSKLGHSPHTRTAMGNGKFPDYISGDSGFVKRMRIRDNSMTLKFPEWVSNYAEEYNCYDVKYVGDYIEDPEFYYGGPGKNIMCP